ncbi:hypothetical protein DXG01_015432 [Tephrocybe rancida]|nr:hypothetical protein DXG01_015432 [Tephrocybe rancida]
MSPNGIPTVGTAHCHVTRVVAVLVDSGRAIANRHVTRETPSLPAMSPNGIPTAGTAHRHVTRVVAVLIDSGRAAT